MTLERTDAVPEGTVPAVLPSVASQPYAPVLPLRTHRPGRYERFLKRAVDVVLAAVALVLLSPVLLAAAAAVRLRLGSPVLYRQQRTGRHGEPFAVLKLRTMGHDRRGTGPRPDGWAGQDRRRTHKSEADPRHTDLGRFLRKTSIDELPQLWNVLRGDMSIVGPRPELVSVVSGYAPWQHARHVVRPGLTGLWQVSARGGRPMHEVTHIDLEYVERLSLRTDLRILLQTPRAVLLKRDGV